MQVSCSYTAGLEACGFVSPLPLVEAPDVTENVGKLLRMLPLCNFEVSMSMALGH